MKTPSFTWHMTDLGKGREPLKEHLLAILTEEACLLRAMRGVLDEEARALVRSPADEIIKTGKKKENILLALKKAAQARNRLTAAEHQGMLESRLKALGLKSRWGILVQEVRTLKQRNHVNGRILRKRLDFVENALATLQQAACPTYGERGRI